MHATMTRARVMLVILAVVATIGLAYGIAPIDPAIMPLPVCPPQC